MFGGRKTYRKGRKACGKTHRGGKKTRSVKSRRGGGVCMMGVGTNHPYRCPYQPHQNMK